jgi:hypothetical protein
MTMQDYPYPQESEKINNIFFFPIRAIPVGQH